MTYTIKGKQYTEFDINKRCAEIEYPGNVYYEQFGKCRVQIADDDDFYLNPCTNPSDTWPIIEKCWDSLMQPYYYAFPKWEHLIRQHNCSKLVAACICFIEINDK